MPVRSSRKPGARGLERPDRPNRPASIATSTGPWSAYFEKQPANKARFVKIQIDLAFCLALYKGMQKRILLDCGLDALVRYGMINLR